jgi:CRISPR-associated endoribonuclease Cas6
MIFFILIFFCRFNIIPANAMRLKLTLQTLHHPAFLPFNYQYPLSAAIYKIIQSADAQFAAFLHNTGYGEGHKSFKLFTFSDIKTAFIQNGDRMQLTTGNAELVVCFYIPQAAENFIKGLFIHQQLQIADSKSKTTFSINQVESLHDNNRDSTNTCLLQPLSPLVIGKKNDRGHYDYMSPEDEGFEACVVHNWLEKFSAATRVDAVTMQKLRDAVSIQVHLLPRPPQSRLITIKGGTAAETRVRGFTRFRLQVTAPEEMLELALGAGLGLHNAQGFGCVEVI